MCINFNKPFIIENEFKYIKDAIDKGVLCEDGAISINNEKYIKHAEIIREKGTNRSKFFRGQIDKYTWVDIGSSYLPSDMIAAFLYSQLENTDKITKKRHHIWNKYDKIFRQYNNIIKTPIIPENCKHNAHMYYLLFKDLKTRTKFIEYMKQNEIMTVFHYIPLHSSPMGKKYCKTIGKMVITDRISETLVRLPMFYELSDEEIQIITTTAEKFLRKQEENYSE